MIDHLTLAAGLLGAAAAFAFGCYVAYKLVCAAVRLYQRARLWLALRARWCRWE